LEDIYIDLLRYGSEHLVDGVTIPEVMAHVREFQPESRLVESENSFKSTFTHVFHPIWETDRYVLSMDGYFNLLEYDELQEARQSSRNALRVAVWAIAISEAWPLSRYICS